MCSFGEFCSFGEDCSFGEWCDFGNGSKIENGKEMVDMLKFEGFGSEKRMTYFFLLTNGEIFVRCGCFSGYLDEFREKVVETHGTSGHAEDYLAIAAIAERHWV